jgi:AAA domain, putative AbiEii toxin, Type IV TA system/AAA ATPase domain
MAAVTIHSVRLRNFKRFESFYLSARVANILVGPNNSGKSSILDALRVCQACLRYTGTRAPTPVNIPGVGIMLGYQLPLSSLPIPIANVTTNYNEQDAVIEIRCTNGNSLVIRLHPDRPIFFYAETEKDKVGTSSLFRTAIPLDLIVVPPLGPFEEIEFVVQDQTVQRNEFSRLANRHFRNIWYRRGIEEWHEFQELVSSSWPGVEIKRPELTRGERAFIQMFYREERGEREVYWSGFGFQVWLQMLMHLMRGTKKSLLILDEPDIYLHPDLQKKLLRIVRERFGQFFMATHSVEIINEAALGDVIAIHPSAKAGKRVLTDEDYQALFNYIGSFENIDFSRLGRARRLVFFEGNDKKLLRRYAEKLGAMNFALDLDTTILQSGGFGQWRRVKETAWTFREVLKLEVDIFALFDRDYRSQEEVDKFLENMNSRGIKCFVLQRKEIENCVNTG